MYVCVRAYACVCMYVCMYIHARAGIGFRSRGHITYQARKEFVRSRTRQMATGKIFREQNCEEFIVMLISKGTQNCVQFTKLRAFHILCLFLLTAESTRTVVRSQPAKLAAFGTVSKTHTHTHTPVSYTHLTLPTTILV